jgi:hypothetical protein
MENDAISYILNPPRLSRVIAMVASKKWRLSVEFSLAY